jgi:dienelactone hydrolase
MKRQQVCPTISSNPLPEKDISDKTQEKSFLVTSIPTYSIPHMNAITRRSIIFGSILIILSLGYGILDHLLFDGVTPQSIQENGFQAEWLVQPQTNQQATVILVGGGQWGQYWGSEFAKAGFSGLSLPYVRQEGLPELTEEIPLEYFEQALLWLKQQPEVDPDKIVVMGASRNAELALLLAATFPEHISGVIAYAPSSVSWSNTVIPMNSDELKPSWTYQQQAIPYVRMEKIAASPDAQLQTLAYWETGLADSAQVAQASIQVENIHGPILLFSGTDDRVWPSAQMSDRIAQRLQTHDFGFDFQNQQYEQVGHLISGNPARLSSLRSGTMPINGISHTFEFGGTPEADQKAQLDAKEKTLAFVQSL